MIRGILKGALGAAIARQTTRLAGRAGLRGGLAGMLGIAAASYALNKLSARAERKKAEKARG